MLKTKYQSIQDPTTGRLNAYHLGRSFDIEKPKAEDVNIRHIAATLAKSGRWGGKGSEFFSVAQHSVLVSYLASQELRFAALLHDASEAFAGEVEKPIKIIIGSVYERIEMRWHMTIAEAFGLSYSDFLRVKEFDLRAAEIEFDALFNDKPEAMIKAFGPDRTFWDWKLAEEMFLSTYNELKP